MEKKYIIGGLALLGVIGGFLLFKSKKNKQQDEQIINGESEIDFDFSNASGSGLSDIINRPKKIIKTKDYQALIKNGSLNELKKYLIGKKIYTLQKGVNLRMSNEVNNGLVHNKLLTIKNKGVHIGRVKDVVYGIDGKNIWILIDSERHNPSFSDKIFFWTGYFGVIDYDNPRDVYVRADVVVVDLYYY
jgi:hypothetical protein